MLATYPVRIGQVDADSCCRIQVTGQNSRRDYLGPKKEKVFFLDAGDGRDFETNDMEGEDLTGWLIPSSKVDEFKIVWEKDEADDDWIDFFTFVSWQKKDGRITVTFKAS